MKTFDFSIDNLPPLTSEKIAELADVAAMSESDIDTSDLPELSTEQLSLMELGPFYRPLKKQITARLDADVLHWLKSKGKGYQTRMNAILRAAMAKDL